MRINENALPEGRSVKVRCPLCNEIGPLQDAASASGPAEGGGGSATRPHDQTTSESGATPSDGGAKGSPSRITGDFRFPAEHGPVSAPKRMFSRKVKMLLWIIGSLLVVGFFALLVNIILPGPYGGGSDTGLPSSEESSTRPEKPRPSQLERESGRIPARR